MQVNLTFNLPEDEYDYKNAANATEMRLLLYDFAQFLRERMKYGEPEKNGDQELMAIRDRFWELCNDRHIDPFE